MRNALKTPWLLAPLHELPPRCPQLLGLLQHLESDPQHAVQLLLSLPLAFWSTLFEQGPAQLPAGVAQVRTAFLQRLLTIIDDSTWGAPLAGAREQDIRARALAVGGGQLAAAWRASVPRSLRRGFSTHPKLVEQMQGQYTAAMHPLRDRRYLLQCIAASADQGDAAAVAVQCAQLTDNVLQGTLGLTGWQVQASVEALCGALQALLQQTGLASVAGDVDEAVRAACCAMLALTQAPAPPSTSLHAAAMAGAAWMQASAQALLGRAPPPWLTSLTTTPTLSECLRPPSAASLVTALAQRCADRLQAVAEGQGGELALGAALSVVEQLAGGSQEAAAAALHGTGAGLAEALGVACGQAQAGLQPLQVAWAVPATRLLGRLCADTAQGRLTPDARPLDPAQPPPPPGRLATVRAAATHALGGPQAEQARLWAVQRAGRLSPWEALLLAEGALSPSPLPEPLRRAGQQALAMAAKGMSRGAVAAVEAVAGVEGCILPGTVRATAGGERPLAEPAQQTAAAGMLAAWVASVTARGLGALPAQAPMPGVRVAELAGGDGCAGAAVPEPYAPLLRACVLRQVLRGVARACDSWQASLGRSATGASTWMQGLLDTPGLATGTLGPALGPATHSPAAALADWAAQLKASAAEASAGLKVLAATARVEQDELFFQGQLGEVSRPASTVGSLPPLPLHPLSTVYVTKALAMLADRGDAAAALVQNGAVPALITAARHTLALDDAYSALQAEVRRRQQAAWRGVAADAAGEADDAHTHAHALPPSEPRVLGGDRWHFTAHTATKLARHAARALANLAYRLPPQAADPWEGARTLVADLARAEDLKLVTQARRAEANMAARSNATTPAYGSMLFPLTDDREAEAPDAAAPDNAVDLVFVHGLQGSALKTWKCPALRLHDTAVAMGGRGADITLRENGVRLPVWPAAWLVPDLKARGIRPRVLSLEYDAAMYTTEGPRPAGPLEDVAARGAAQLAAARIGRNGDGSSRPVLFIVHSMGGLVTKAMLSELHARGEGASGHGAVEASTAGILFYATPHRGSPLGRLIPPTQLPWVRSVMAVSHPVKHLGEGDPLLLQLHGQFMKYVAARQEEGRPLFLSTVVEGRPTDVETPGIPTMFIVPQHSAELGVGQLTTVDADHVNICKPSASTDASYTLCREFVVQALAQPGTPPVKVDGGVLCAEGGAVPVQAA